MNHGAKTKIRIGTEEAVVLVGADENDGAILALEVTMPPGGGPPVPHRHAPAELYRVEEGELTLYVENDEGRLERNAAPAGQLVHIPASRLHTIRNESSAPARAIAIFAPGAEIERFFRAAGEVTDPADIVRIAGWHGITFEEAPDAG